MTIALLVTLAILLVAGMLLAARGRAATIRNLSELEGRTRPVDVVAFRNLIDPREEQYLRAALPRRAFRKVQRERLRAALAYVGSVAQNAAIVLRLGESAQNDPQHEIARVGRALSEQALRLRILAAMAAIKISVRILIPELQLSPAVVMDAYCQLSGQVMELCRHQMPANASRVVAAL
jgi:hypothetical protein